MQDSDPVETDPIAKMAHDMDAGDEHAAQEGFESFLAGLEGGDEYEIARAVNAMFVQFNVYASSQNMRMEASVDFADLMLDALTEHAREDSKFQRARWNVSLSVANLEPTSQDEASRLVIPFSNFNYH